jgi:hypothetical protein
MCALSLRMTSGMKIREVWKQVVQESELRFGANIKEIPSGD